MGNNSTRTSVTARLGALAGGLSSLVGVLVFLVGFPIALIRLVGWPLPEHWPTSDEWMTFAQHPITVGFLVKAMACAGWLIWAVAALAVAAELVGRIIRVEVPRVRLATPVQAAAAGLVGTIVLTVTSTAARANTPPTVPTAANPSPKATPDATRPSVEAPRARVASTIANHHGPITFSISGKRYRAIVHHNDSMWTIARQWLGNPERFHEICTLNKHRHFPKVGGTLRDCNLIYPGWDLILPADATPPPGAQPIAPPTQPAEPRTHPTAPQGGPATPTAPTTPGTTAATSTAVASSTAPATTPTSRNPATPQTAATGGPRMPAQTPSIPAVSDEHGVHLADGSWLPWAAAAAIAAAAAMVWRQRRRRFTGEPDDDPPAQLRPAVTQVSTLVLRNPTPSDAPADTEPIADLMSIARGGVGLAGDGAPAAARAALVAALASGDLDHPHARGEVVIDAATLSTLIGSDAVTLGPWPRLHIADDIHQALTLVEARLLHHSRVLDEHALTDLDTLHQAPDEEALPPVLLITHTPAADTDNRMKVALGLGTRLNITAVLIGPWPHGLSIDIAGDGHTEPSSASNDAQVPVRLPVCAADTTVQLLATLREAQTGQPTSAGPPGAPVALHASRTVRATTAIAEPAVATVAHTVATDTPAPDKARLRVLGTPQIENITAPGRPLRAKALELAVLLACHPDGLATRDIGEYLEPDARLSQADQRVHTNASNLRHVLGRAGGPHPSTYLIKVGGRYRLDPTTVDVDIWQLRDILNAAAIATTTHRRALLQTACDLYTAPLADGQHYDWITPHRETVRRWGTEAHLLLAEDLLTADPQAAADLLDKAIRLDRYNEALYRTAMRARHAQGDPDSIHALLRALTKALADLDTSPSDDTIALATQLRAGLKPR